MPKKKSAAPKVAPKRNTTVNRLNAKERMELSDWKELAEEWSDWKLDEDDEGNLPKMPKKEPGRDGHVVAVSGKHYKSLGLHDREVLLSRAALYLLQNKIPNAASMQPKFDREMLEGFRRLGEQALAVLEAIDPTCDDYQERMKKVRRLLGKPNKMDIVIRLNDIEVPADFDPIVISERDYLVRIVRKKGNKTVVEGTPDLIDENDGYY